MKAYSDLPQDYVMIHSVDLQRDKRLLKRISVLSLILMLVFGVIGHLSVPVTQIFGDPDCFIFSGLILRGAVMLIGTVFYIILHELTHAAAMKLCGTKKVRFGFTGMYAYAGSDDWYDMTAYVFIALAPVVFWGIVLLILCCIVPKSWFWAVYFIQLTNLSGAAGDLYVTSSFPRFPQGTLVKDSGVAMTLWNKPVH